jgi:sensor domain CHASE-containing protein
MEERPRGDLNPYLQYLEIGLFPVYISAVPVVSSEGKLPSRLVPELTERHRTQSLRQLAKEYGVSHEAVRRVIAKARNSALDKRLSKTRTFR